MPSLSSSGWNPSAQVARQEQPSAQSAPGSLQPLQSIERCRSELHCMLECAGAAIPLQGGASWQCSPL